MDIGRAFTFVTQDRDWIKKVLLGGLISFIPLVGQFYVVGYALEALGNILKGRELPLPEVTEDVGGKLVKGVLMWVILLVYALPLILIAGCSGGGVALIPGMAKSKDTADMLAAIWSSCFGCVTLIYAALMSLFVPFVWATYAETGQIGDAFKVNEIFGMIKATIGQTIIVVLVSGLAMSVAVSVGMLICGVGQAFTAFYVLLVNAFLYASLYRQARGTVL